MYYSIKGVDLKVTQSFKGYATRSETKAVFLVPTIHLNSKVIKSKPEIW